jgi:vacuolar-type H+-ATPase subunit H
LQILPEKEWVRHFKESEPVNLVDKQVQLQALEDNDIVPEAGEQSNKVIAEAEQQAHESKIKITMMQRINNEKERRVTAKVIGIIKPMNKTYGGSILKYED